MIRQCPMEIFQRLSYRQVLSLELDVTFFRDQDIRDVLAWYEGLVLDTIEYDGRGSGCL